MPGNALRTRDENFQGGVPKAEYAGRPKALYRLVYTTAVNHKGEAAVVKSTTGKGHNLPSGKGKFKPHVHIKDDTGAPIKPSPKGATNKKFVRSSKEDLSKSDVEYINKKINKHADTHSKISELKTGRKPPCKPRKK